MDGLPWVEEEPPSLSHSLPHRNHKKGWRDEMCHVARDVGRALPGLAGADTLLSTPECSLTEPWLLPKWNKSVSSPFASSHPLARGCTGLLFSCGRKNSTTTLDIEGFDLLDRDVSVVLQDKHQLMDRAARVFFRQRGRNRTSLEPSSWLWGKKKDILSSLTRSYVLLI